MRIHSTVLGVYGATLWRGLAAVAMLLGLQSCGGGGGGPVAPTERPEGVYTGFSPAGNLDWALPAESGGAGGGDGVGAGADGDGGVGAGGDFGQFRNVLVVVKYPDGTPVGNGQALTDATSGMVTVKPRRGYQGPLYLELRGQADSSYYEEGKDAFVPFPAGTVIRVWLPRIDKNIGITPFTEAAYRLLTEGSTPEKAAGVVPTAVEIRAANDKVRKLLNQQFPTVLAVDDITRLPFIKSPSVSGQITTNPRGIYGLVNGAFSKQAAMFNPGEAAPTLAAITQLSADLLDGRLDGMNGTQPAVAAHRRTYDANTLTGELTSALAEQAERFGTTDARGLLPVVLNFGNSRYEGYLFDASLKPGGEAVTTVSGFVTEDRLGRPVGTESARKLPGRTYAVFGNLGHGGLFLKSNAADSQSKLYALGDNTRGELGDGSIGLGTRAQAGDAVEIKFPTAAAATHVAGGMYHTVARMADGTVYVWGDDSHGQLGQGAASPAGRRAETPIKVNLPMGALSVAASNTASYALLEDGRVYAWGASLGFGLLGNGEKDNVRNTPGPVLVQGGELNDVVQLVARDNDAMVVRRDGTVLTWGSFPSDTLLPSAFRGGSALATPVGGLTLAPDVQIRKILVEQGLFVMLTDDGMVYSWGVYFDISAQAVLRDASPVRVLGLPMVRDLMPGGYLGYSSRAEDRLTAMAIDYNGNLWRVRGRVAERFNLANPTETHRTPSHPAEQGCVSCHSPLTAWPAVAPAPSDARVCTPPPAVHGELNALLINARTECALCHNPNRKTVALPTGWLNCQHPILPPPAPLPPAPKSGEACQLPVSHTITPTGTACASCHNSVIQPVLSCASTPGPGLSGYATIRQALDDLSAAIAQDGATTDTTPSLVGTLTAELAPGQALVMRRNGTVVGQASVNGTEWRYTDSGAGDGLHTYTARIEEGASVFGLFSNAFSLIIDTLKPNAAISITSLLGDGAAIANGHATGDTTPAVAGQLSAALAPGEFVQILRNGVALNKAASADIVLSGSNWVYTEPTALAPGAHAYAAQVLDAAGNAGAAANGWSLLINTAVNSLAGIASANNDAGVAIADGSSTRDTTPRLQGTVSAPLLPGQQITVLRDGAAMPGAATVDSATGSWQYTEPGAADGPHTYTARVVQRNLLGPVSAGYLIVVDTLKPSLTPHITGVIDQNLGAIANGGTSTDDTPLVTGTLPTAVGAGESVLLWRGLTPLTTARIVFSNPTAWSYQEGELPAQGPYVYSAQVIDAAGNAGPFGTPWTVYIDARSRSATIVNALNDSVAPTGSIASGGATRDSTPTLEGSISSALVSGQSVVLRRNGTVLGHATVVGTGWRFTDGNAPNGMQRYSARVEGGGTPFGGASNEYLVLVDTAAPHAVAQVTALNDRNLGSVPMGGTSTDHCPTISGTLSTILGTSGAPERVQLLRNGNVVADAVAVTGSTWSHTETVCLSVGSYSYQARVVDAAGNVGALGAAWSVVIDDGPRTATITGAFNDEDAGKGFPVAYVAPYTTTVDATPLLKGSISAPLVPGQIVKVLRNGIPMPGSATFSSTLNWSYNDPGVGFVDGVTFTYTARVDTGTLLGTPSAPGYSFVIDNVRP